MKYINIFSVKNKHARWSPLVALLFMVGVLSLASCKEDDDFNLIPFLGAYSLLEEATGTLTSTSTSTDDSTSTDSSTSTDDSTSTDGSTSTDDSTSTDGSTSTDDSTSTDGSTSTDDSTSTDGSTSDATAPTPGGSGTLSTSSVASTSLTLSWSAGSDDTSAAANLEYKVVYSTSNNITSLANAKANGTTAMDWTANTTSKGFTGLNPATGYYFNVLIRDEAANEAVYDGTSEGTILAGTESLYTFTAGDTFHVGSKNNTVSLTALSDGNVMICYRDGDDSDKGKYVVYDSNGAIVSGVGNSGTFSNTGEGVIAISATTLESGNVAIAYVRASDSSGRLVILDSSDSWNKSAYQTFETNTVSYLSATPLSNGNVFVAYIDSGSGAGEFDIYMDDAAATATGVIDQVFDAGIESGADLAASTLPGGNVVIAYMETGDNHGVFQIYNASGGNVLTKTKFSGVGPLSYVIPGNGRFDVSALKNGNILFVYPNLSSSNNGTFVIYDASGTLVAGPTVFASVDVDQLDSHVLSSGDILISYGVAGTYAGYYDLYSEDGSMAILNDEEFKSSGAGTQSISQFGDGFAIIGYSNADTSGEFVIIE